MMMYETARNMHVAVVLLNEALEQLSQGHFTVDEYGNADTPASWPHDYGPQYDPDKSRLAGKYRELWDRNDLELAFDTEDRSRPFFAAMAADGLLSYRTEVTENFQPSAMAWAEKHLIDTVVEFYRAFHTYRRLAEEHLNMTLDEFLGASQTERLPFDDRTGPRRLTEEECRDALERMQLYIDAYEESQQKVGEVLAEGAPVASLAGSPPRHVYSPSALVSFIVTGLQIRGPTVHGFGLVSGTPQKTIYTHRITENRTRQPRRTPPEQETETRGVVQV